MCVQLGRCPARRRAGDDGGTASGGPKSTSAEVVTMGNYRGRTPGTRRVVIWVRGERHERIVTGTKQEARAYEARLRVELEAGRPLVTRVVPTFFDFCVNRYRPHAEAHLRPNTWKVRPYQLATLEDFFGKLRLTEFSTDAIERYKNLRRRQVGSHRTVNNELKVLQAVFAYAREL